jgi:hypothetical protein
VTVIHKPNVSVLPSCGTGFTFKPISQEAKVSVFDEGSKFESLPAIRKFAIIIGFPDSQGVFTRRRANPADLATLAAPCCHQAHKNHVWEDFLASRIEHETHVPAI